MWFGSSTIIVFVHGFQGSKKSFLDFPNDLKQLLPYQVSIEHYEYETHGSFEQKTIELRKYLQHKVSTFTSVVVVCHSMGGPLSVDAAKGLKLKGILTFDSPFFGLDHDTVAAHGMEKARDALGSISSLVSDSPSSSRSSLFGIGAAVLAAGAFMYASNSSVKSAVDGLVTSQSQHVYKSAEFLGPLWHLDNQKGRFQTLDTPFRGMYLQLKGDRFCKLPPSEYATYFTPHNMTGPKTVVDAHMSLFDPLADQGYPLLVQFAVDHIRSFLS
ncbi:hypothetical protein EDD86DRAFT_211494 [Gorgonomyces haynaldii]|nr:hypothetical protein EDD86DRAFT_211494 [Gorgonomyces haynaldii]